MLSKNFRSLLESMKSTSNEIDEDRDARIERREERRKERREDKFGVSTDSTSGVTAEIESNTDFKIGPFSRAVQQLKAQVQSEIFSIDQTIKNRESGAQSASTYKEKFTQISEIISRISSKLDLIKGRKEGRNLEAGTEQDPKDLAEIKLLRGLYSTAANDFLEAQKQWSETKLEADNKYLSDLKDTDTNNFLRASAKAFTEVQAMLNELIRSSQIAVDDKGNKGADGSKGAENLATGDIIKGGKYTKDSKEGKIVIEVKKTIYAKFKKYLGKTKDWGIVYKSGVDKVSGTLLANTQNVIKGVKGGLVDDYPELKSDKTGDITPAFIAAINKVTESKENTSGRLITFENFIKGRVNEAFNQASAEAAMSGGGSSNSSGGSKNTGDKPKVKAPEYSATPFANDTEGNKFRAWVIKNKAEWAKSNNLDATGAKDNTYVRKAYKEFGEEYKKSAKVSEVVKKDVLTNDRLDTIEKIIKSYGTKTEIKLTIAGKEPYILFYSGKEYGFFYNTRKVTYVAAGGKTSSGIYDSGTKSVKFSNGKSFSFESVAKFQISDSLTSEKAEIAQGKKAYVASSSGTKVYSSSTYKDLDYSGNVIVKYDTKDKFIGLVISTTKRDGKTLYKVNFPETIRPNKNGSNTFDSGWVKADTVTLK